LVDELTDKVEREKSTVEAKTKEQKVAEEEQKDYGLKYAIQRDKMEEEQSELRTLNQRS
jgi:hypothetical protein